MSVDFKKIAEVADGAELILPVNGAQLYNTGIAGMEELVVSQSVDRANLRNLLECLVQENCVHSWRNFGPEGTLEELLRWENELRPTKIFFFYLEHDGETYLIGTGAVADRLSQDFPHPGFCVLGRCYIMPQFRCRGFYRHLLHYRMEYCKTQFGNSLNAIHIGSINERVSRAIANHQLTGWPRFFHLGEEELRVAGQIKTVGAYLLFAPEYIRRIRRALAGPHAPECVIELRNTLAEFESGGMSNLGMRVKEAFEEACEHGWFDKRRSPEIEQLLLFCSSVPLVGFKCS